jgi:hypothetical protein
MKKFNIINLVREDFNKAIVFYGVTSEKVSDYFEIFHKWLENNKNSDLYVNIQKNDSGNPIIQNNMACIDILVDDNWWSDSDLKECLNEIITD